METRMQGAARLRRGKLLPQELSELADAFERGRAEGTAGHFLARRRLSAPRRRCPSHAEPRAIILPATPYRRTTRGL